MRSKKLYDNFTQTITPVQSINSSNKSTQTTDTGKKCSVTSATQTLNKILRDDATQTELKSSLKQSSVPTPAPAKNNSFMLSRVATIVPNSDEDEPNEPPIVVSTKEAAKTSTTGTKSKKIPNSIESNWVVAEDNKVVPNLGRLTRSEESLIEESSRAGAAACDRHRNRNLSYRDNRDDLNRLFKKPSLDNLRLSGPSNGSNKGLFCF